MTAPNLEATEPATEHVRAGEAPEYPLAGPRLADLFVLTFFFSVFLGLCRYSFTCDFNFALFQVSSLEAFGYGLGVACCWTGLLRLRFVATQRGWLPLRQWQPGEVICAVEGVYYLLAAVIGTLLRLFALGGEAAPAEDAEDTLSLFAVAAIYVPPALLMGLGYAWMASHVTVPSWKRAAVAKVVAHVGGPVLLLALVSDPFSELWLPVSIGLFAAIATPTAMVLWATVGDRTRLGVHWTHWLGVFALLVIYCARLSLEVRALVQQVEQ